MELTQAFKSGAAYLCNLTAGLFGKTHEDNDGVRLEEVISFPTGKNHEPFNVNCKLLRLPDSWGKHAYRIIFETENARHPFDKKGEFGYMGKEIMNPALLTSLNKVEQVINDSAVREIERLKLQKSTSGYLTGRIPKAQPFGGGVSLSVTLNVDDNPHRAKYSQIVQLYQSMVDAVKEEGPVIQKHIEQSVVLQPLPNPTAEDLAIFDSEITAVMARGISRATGFSPDTKFVEPDGTVRGIIKGHKPGFEM